MQLIIRNYPYLLLKDLEDLLKKLRLVSRENSDVIEILPEESDLFKAKEIFLNSNFSFRLYSPSLSSNNKANYYFDKTPHSLNSIKKYTGSGDSQFIIDVYKSWIENLKKYHTISLTEEEVFEKASQEEFIEYF